MPSEATTLNVPGPNGGREMRISSPSRVIWPQAGVTKLELHVFPHNAPALALYESRGYEREGVRRAHYRRATGEIAVTSGTEGPGFTNMIGALASANAVRNPSRTASTAAACRATSRGSAPVSSTTSSSE